jgi:hypothetical protein
MVEMIMVMTLLILFGVTVFTLISSGSNAQNKIINDKSSQTDARIAISYLNVKLRQNSEADKISVKPCPITGVDSILIETGGESAYDTWIFFEGGALYEFLGSPGDEPSMNLSVKIMDIKGFDISYDGGSNSVTVKAIYDYNEATKSISATLNLRVSGNRALTAD